MHNVEVGPCLPLPQGSGFLPLAVFLQKKYHVKFGRAKSFDSDFGFIWFKDKKKNTCISVLAAGVIMYDVQMEGKYVLLWHKLKQRNAE